MSKGITKLYETEHPEGYLRLMNERLLPLYAKGEEAVLDEVAANVEVELFVEHIPYLWEQRERILSDSRLFLCPLAVPNGVAYFGYFPTATLGAYVELWQMCKDAIWLDEEGLRHFVWRVSGSPLSGNNKCGLISETRERSIRSLDRFGTLWRVFVGIICRYRDIQPKGESYRIAEVIELLKR